MLSPNAHVHHVHSLAPGRVRLPPMPIGSGFLERWPVHEEPGAISWRAPDFECMAPATFVLRDVTVHGSSGIIEIGDSVVAETLAARDPHRAANGMVLERRRRRHLPGMHISVLAASSGNYFHALFDGVFRLSMIPDAVVQASTGLLHPAGAVAQRDLLDLVRLQGTLARREVDDDESFHIDALIFPWTVYGLSSFHPCVTVFFDRISSHVAAGGDLPRRIYLDPSGSAQRRLVNEYEVIEALRGQGFVPIRPETLGVAEQIRLFRGADAIVAPHGAGLTNLGFCRPGCVVLELQMDRYVHWSFRHLAALRGLAYDCVVGRALPLHSGGSLDIQAARWQISATHVAGAIGQMLATA